MQAMSIQVSVGKKSLTCSIDAGKPRVEYKKKAYSSLSALCKVVPELQAPDNLGDCARVATFFTSGTEYLLIEDILAFSRSYRRRIWQEKSSMSHTLPRLCDFGVFDISGIRAPYVEGGKIIFYVEQNGTGVPFKATFADETVTYSRLPEAE